jgi:hypothetical protein
MAGTTEVSISIDSVAEVTLCTSSSSSSAVVLTTLGFGLRPAENPCIVDSCRISDDSRREISIASINIIAAKSSI